MPLPVTTTLTPVLAISRKTVSSLSSSCLAKALSSSPLEMRTVPLVSVLGVSSGQEKMATLAFSACVTTAEKGEERKEEG